MTPPVKTALKRTSTSEFGSIGKIPPNASDLEEKVLGALLVDSKAIHKVADILKSVDFYDEKHGIIYEAIFELFANRSPVDLNTVNHQLRKNGNLELAGGSHQLAFLSSNVSSAASIEYHAGIIKQMAVKREVIQISTRAIENAYDETTDAFELLDESENSYFQLSQEISGKGDFVDGIQAGHELKTELERRQSLPEGITGVPSGFTDLDRKTHGFQRGEFIVIGARPGMGKTSFVVSIIDYLLSFTKIPVAIISLEMSRLQIMSKLVSINTEIRSETFKTGKLDEYDWKRFTNSPTISRNLFIDDTSGLNVFTLRTKIRRLVERNKVELLIIDYLQLITLDLKNGNREQEISKISRTLKEIARECNITIIALSQLNRSVETRGGDKRPQLSDLRESGSLEQDADIVMFLYRAEYYKITVDENNLSTEGRGEAIIAKHRNGSLGTIPLKFNAKCTKFLNIEESDRSHWQEAEVVNDSKGSDDQPF